MIETVIYLFFIVCGVVFLTPIVAILIKDFGNDWLDERRYNKAREEYFERVEERNNKLYEQYFGQRSKRPMIQLIKKVYVGDDFIDAPGDVMDAEFGEFAEQLVGEDGLFKGKFTLTLQWEPDADE